MICLRNICINTLHKGDDDDDDDDDDNNNNNTNNLLNDQQLTSNFGHEKFYFLGGSSVAILPKTVSWLSLTGLRDQTQ